MSFPVSPLDGQLATVNSILYVYSATNNTWTRIPGTTVLGGVSNTTGSLIWSTANSAVSFANGAFSIANGAFDKANNSADFANGAFAISNGAAMFANGAFGVANSGSSFANGAFTAANNAGNFANSAYGLANTNFTLATNAGNFANGAFAKANTPWSYIQNGANTVTLDSTGQLNLPQITQGGITAGYLTSTGNIGLNANGNLWKFGADGTMSSPYSVGITTTGFTMPGSTSGSVAIKTVAVAGTTTIIFPATSGNVVTTGDIGTVTNTMLVGSIANAKLVKIGRAHV